MATVRIELPTYKSTDEFVDSVHVVLAAFPESKREDNTVNEMRQVTLSFDYDPEDHNTIEKIILVNRLMPYAYFDKSLLKSESPYVKNNADDPLSAQYAGW